MSLCKTNWMEKHLPMEVAAITAFFSPSERPEGCEIGVAWLRLVFAVAARCVVVVAGVGLLFPPEDCCTDDGDELEGADDSTEFAPFFTALDVARCRESNEVLCVARDVVCVDV